MLNKGFFKVEKFHLQIQKLVKGQLPRRESERRNHPLAKHINALSAIETRLSLLNMTFVKYMDMGVCCFIPGKVFIFLFFFFLLKFNFLGLRFTMQLVKHKRLGVLTA